MEGYQVFLDSLAQLEDDQSFYEGELSGKELTGVQHEEIIKMGGIMARRMRKFAEKGRSFAESLSPDFVNKLIDSIQAYQNLIMPPKVFGGMCPCLKPARSGPEYDTKMLTVKAKMTVTVFVVQAVLVENKGEQHNMDSMHYSDYVNKMNTVFNGLSEINCTGNGKALEAARKKLLAAVDSVDRFIQHFGDSGGKADFKAEAVRRIKAAQELLSARPTAEDGSFLPPNRRLLVKAQSSLQEIMNSAAAIALTQAKENLASLEKLSTLLKKIRNTQTSTLQAMEDDMRQYNLMDLLHRVREDADIHFADCNSKLRDATKRWTTIKSQSNPRKVAEYTDEATESSSSNALMKPLPGMPGMNPDLDPQRLFQQTGKKIMTMSKVVTVAVSGTKGVFETAASEISTGVKTVTTNAKNAVTSGGEKVKKAFTGEDAAAASTSSATVATKTSSTGSTPTNKIFNPFENIMGNSSSTTEQPKKRDASKNKFLPLDAF